MKIRLIDGTVHVVTRADVTNGRLEIDFTGKTAEEIQEIFATPANLQNIEVLTDDGVWTAGLPGWTVYGGIYLIGDKKTVVLSKPVDVTEERLTNAEAKAIQAEGRATEAENKAASLAEELTQTQVALCEVYELVGGIA